MHTCLYVDWCKSARIIFLKAMDSCGATQCIATQCNALQHIGLVQTHAAISCKHRRVAVRCNKLQCKILQHTHTHTLQHTTIYCQHKLHCKILQHTYTVQHTATYCKHPLQKRANLLPEGIRQLQSRATRYTATHCSTRQQITSHSTGARARGTSFFRRHCQIATQCNKLHCSKMQHTVTHCNMLDQCKSARFIFLKALDSLGSSGMSYIYTKETYIYTKKAHLYEMNTQKRFIHTHTRHIQSTGVRARGSFS